MRLQSADSHLCVEATGCLQEQRQVGLDLAAVGVGPVLGLALQRGDLVLESMVPPAQRQGGGVVSPAGDFRPMRCVCGPAELTGLAPPSCPEHTPGQ